MHLDMNLNWVFLSFAEDMLVAIPDGHLVDHNFELGEVERCYVAGPMRNREKWNFPAFDAARDQLLSQGVQVISPADLDRARGITEDTTEFSSNDFKRAMWIDTLALLNCNRIHMLEGWDESVGARYEMMLAQHLGLKITFADDALVGTTEIEMYRS
jgi:hypothetical protein